MVVGSGMFRNDYFAERSRVVGVRVKAITGLLKPTLTGVDHLPQPFRLGRRVASFMRDNTERPDVMVDLIRFGGRFNYAV